LDDFFGTVTRDIPEVVRRVLMDPDCSSVGDGDVSVVSPQAEGERVLRANH
jgi:hypothetical protein